MSHPRHGGVRSIVLEGTAVVCNAWQIRDSCMHGRDPRSRREIGQTVPQAGRSKRRIGVAEPLLQDMGLTVRQRIGNFTAPDGRDSGIELRTAEQRMADGSPSSSLHLWASRISPSAVAAVFGPPSRHASIAHGKTLSHVRRLFHFIDHRHRVILDRYPALSVRILQQLISPEPEFSRSLAGGQVG